MMDWYLIKEPRSRQAAENMAIDEFLFNKCHDRPLGFLRLYTWATPTFSIGVSQQIQKVLDLDYIEAQGFSYVRRITGGKTVLHDDEITYSVISSENLFFRQHDLYKSYLIISRILLNAFLKLGVPAYLHEGHNAQLARSNHPCFSFPTPHEIEIRGKKIVGSAQKRNNMALLQHGSIPLTMDYDRYARGTHADSSILQRSMTTLSETGDISRADLSDKIIQSLQDFGKMKLNDYSFSPSDQKDIEILTQKYKSREWNFLK